MYRSLIATAGTLLIGSRPWGRRTSISACCASWKSCSGETSTSSPSARCAIRISSNRSTDRGRCSMHPNAPKLLEDIRDAAAFVRESVRGLTQEEHEANRPLNCPRCSRMSNSFWGRRMVPRSARTRRRNRRSDLSSRHPSRLRDSFDPSPIRKDNAMRRFGIIATLDLRLRLRDRLLRKDRRRDEGSGQGRGRGRRERGQEHQVRRLRRSRNRSTTTSDPAAGVAYRSTVRPPAMAEAVCGTRRSCSCSRWRRESYSGGRRFSSRGRNTTSSNSGRYHRM